MADITTPSIWLAVGIIGIVAFWYIISKAGSSVHIEEESL